MLIITISLYTNQKISKSEIDVEQLKLLNPDLIIVVAYGLILPQAVLDIPTHGCINIHGSILPRWRGAAPVQFAILNGDRETGVTIFQLDRGVDTGEILTIKKCSIATEDTTESLLNKLMPLGIEATLEVIKKINSNSLTSSKQEGNLATFAPKIEKSDAILQWDKEDAKNLARKIRAYHPWPGTYLEVNDATKIKIIAAKEVSDVDLANSNIPPGKIVSIEKEGIIIKAKTNAIAITKLKFPGSKTLSAIDVKNSSKYLAILKSLQV